MQITILGIVLVLGMQVGCGVEKEYQDVAIIMGTIVQQKVWAKEDVTEEIFHELLRIEEELLSTNLPTSEIFLINQGGLELEGIVVSKELVSYIKQVEAISLASEGALDITIYPLVELWDIENKMNEEEPQIPDEESIKKVLRDVDYQRLRIEDGKIYLQEGMGLHLGAIGKGIASDVLLDYIKENQLAEYGIISVGGCVVTFGEKKDNAPWNIAIQNPQKQDGEDSIIGSLEIYGDWVISTSGDYERFFQAEGSIYHHILNPMTGYPVNNELSAVTILAKNGLVSDALSTACFVLGEEKGMKLAQQYDVHILMVKKGGDVVMSEGMEEFYRQ